ncbi:aggregation-promoting factor C-terminal-like domain-containing protein [Nocardioides massiliensis]|uniref:Lytic transglycosylase domain-containing protein n=1 Tax=Nocardioides massiliensis TaxID=1325935 RepID=A0ABT9NJK0_9ACTN|nr:hypothetical protein [Nocardioides massiliensis]MDP9820596.1 hypothetical protein [Nocardioides massiliensis]
MLLPPRYVPRHRAEAPARPPRRAARIAVVSLATLGTGGAISAGVLAGSGEPAGTSAVVASAVSDEDAATLRAEREQVAERASRAGGRASLSAEAAEGETADGQPAGGEPDETKMLTLAPPAGGAVTGVDDLADADPREIAQGMLGEFGFGSDQWGCLDQLWISESDWEVDADNPTSSAYGIPQALTGGTHDDLPADYMTNPVSQIRWGLGYIRDAYGTPCSAWSFKQANNWY